MKNKSSGRGAYTEAIFTVKKQTKLNIFVGSQGLCDNKTLDSNFYNAGINYIGIRGLSSCTGGGSTFITVNDNISDVLIASGSGGGVGFWDGVENSGGYGGYIGQDGQDFNYNLFHSGGGTQDKGGLEFSFVSPSASCTSFPGKFLTGGNANGCSGASSGGGGGGYYGGGGGVDVGGGGGGSSFVRNDLRYATFYNGNETFLSPSGFLETGHSGNGTIIIQHLYFISSIQHYIWFLPFSFYNLISSK